MPKSLIHLKGISRRVMGLYLAQVHVQAANEAALVNTVGFQILSFRHNFCRK